MVDRCGALLIGTGRRTEHYFVPALRCLPDLYVIKGVHSRQRANVERVARRWGIPAIVSLEEVDWREIGLVAVSITTRNVPEILMRLAQHAQRLILFVDTPVLGRVRDLWALALLKRFLRVVVAEDVPRFPRYELARGIVLKGELGPIRSTRLIHSGYNHHGLALIRSLLGMRFPLSISVSSTGLEFGFVSGATGSMVEPYRKEGGHFEIVGERGILTDRAGVGGTRPVYLLEARSTAGLPLRFSVRIDGSEHVCEPQGLTALDTEQLPDPSLFGLETVSGLVSLLREASVDRAVPLYGALDAVHDYLAPGLARRLGFLPNPLAILGARA